MLSAKDSLQVNEWYSLTSLAGFVVLLIVGVLTSIVILASFFTSPRRSAVTLVFLASMALIGVGAAVFTYLLGVVFSLVVP